jgi:two-component system, sensor histidine kinase FlrB
MPALPLPDDDSDKARALRQAFAVFNEVSAELTQAYEQLQGKVASLTAELAVANGELRRQYEEKQALSERLGLLLNTLPAGVVVLDGAGLVAELNPAARLMLAEDVLGRPWHDAVGERLVATDTPEEWWLLPAAGQGVRRRLNVAEQPLPSAGARILLLHDVTSAHEMKASLDRNQRLAAMGEMAASLAHQLRTPLSTALLYSANLGKPGLADDARVRFADKATEQLRRLERLIHDVLLFARGEEIGREVIPVNEMLLEAANEVEPVFREKGVRLDTHGADGNPIIVGGRKPLGSALVSLLENALQASPQGGTVALSATLAGRTARIAVRDAGPGIAPDLLDRVFEPFFTTRAQGTGLGLAIALGVLRAHGGRIEVTSSLGEGAEFVLILPADAGRN